VAAFTFSRKGDGGETSLLEGGRVSKASLRPEAYGTLDEAGSALGLARALTENGVILEIIGTVQNHLFLLGADLARAGAPAPPSGIASAHTLWLEEWIARLQDDAPMPSAFVCPGANAVSAAIDLGRTIIRRAERRVVALKEAGEFDNPGAHAYLNRLADLLFILARYAEKHG
jgi:cob(I)alamin adenosyltransferase